MFYRTFLLKSSMLRVESRCSGEAMTALNQATSSQCGVFTYKHPKKCVVRMMEGTGPSQLPQALKGARDLFMVYRARLDLKFPSGIN